MTKKKNIGMISHHTDKRDIIEWVKYNEGSLKDTIIYATYETGHEIEDNTGLKVEKEAELKLGDDFSLKIKFKESKKGGDQEIGSLLVAKLLDYFIYFWDPLTPQPHDVAVKSLLRNAVLYKIALACNPSTADHLITSNLFPRSIYTYGSK